MRSHVVVQASSAELEAELDRVGALELDGGWRAVDTAYMTTLTDMLLLTTEQNGWNLGAIPEEGTCDALAADGYDARCRPCQAAEVLPSGRPVDVLE